LGPSQPFGQLLSAHVGQRQIQQDDLGPELLGDRDGLPPVEGQPHLVPLDPEQHPHHPGGVPAVVDHKDSHPRTSLPAPRLRVVHVPPPGGYAWPPVRSTRLATTATSSAGSTGLATCVWNPARSARRLSSDRAKAVRATAGSALAATRPRTWRIRSYPSRSGMPTSLTRMSGRNPSTSCIASSTEEATVTSAPQSARIRRTRVRASPSSSTTSTRMPESGSAEQSNSAGCSSFGRAFSGGASCTTVIGRLTTNVEPCPSPGLLARTVPPCSSVN